jgi:hypothetical protein
MFWKETPKFDYKHITNSGKQIEKLKNWCISTSLILDKKWVIKGANRRNNTSKWRDSCNLLRPYL